MHAHDRRLPEDAVLDSLPRPSPEGGDTSPGSLRDALQRYLAYRGMRGSTVQGLLAVRRYGDDFIAWCVTQRVHQVRQVDARLLQAYQQALHAYRQRNGQPLSVNARLAKLVPVRGWLLWLLREGKLSSDPVAAMELPRADRVLPRHMLGPIELQRLLAEPDTRRPIGLRDRAMLELLYSSGLRRMELAGLQMKDLDLSRRLLWVRLGKGRKDRVLPITDVAVYWLQRYLHEVRPRLVRPSIDTGQVFLGAYGRPLSLAWLSQIISQHLRHALPGHVGSCHLLRHAMATQMLEGGADIRYIQAMLGHAQLGSTQIYTHVAIGRLQEVHAKTHPRASAEDTQT